MATVSEIVQAMREAAPSGLQDLPENALNELQSLTDALMSAMVDAEEDCRRFAATRDRRVAIDKMELRAWLSGKSVLVTGGTGCIGSTLLAEIALLGPRQLVSISRGLTRGWPTVAQAEYLQADITNKSGIAGVVSQVRPDVVFHLAAQRDPGLAEREVRRTVVTNIFGTRNVVDVCAEFGVEDVICATSGKALRPYSREVYTAAKRSAEWILAGAALRTDGRLSAVRFTHVVNNSIVYNRLLNWTASGVVRLHDPATMFYAQSALESAQLMLCAGVRGRQGSLRIYAMNDLGQPISLLGLAVGTLRRAGSASPIYFSGHEPGYESVPFPGLYDPATAGDLSPLLSVFDAIKADHYLAAGIDAGTATLDLAMVSDEALTGLERACENLADPAAVRQSLDQLSWLMFDGTIAAMPLRTLRRAAALAEPYEAELSYEHQMMLARIRNRAQVGELAHA